MSSYYPLKNAKLLQEDIVEMINHYNMSQHEKRLESS